MTQPEHSHADAPLPKPKVKKMRWPFPMVWVIPVLALVGAGYYFYDSHRKQGPAIDITFADANGVKPGETSLTVHGVEVGRVSAVALTDDQQRVVVHVQLLDSAASIAKEGAVFWIVRPDFSNGNISGLGTIVSGPHIEGVAGTGASAVKFTGSDQQPLTLGPGMKIILHSEHLDHLQPNSPVYYRGIQTGVVQDVRFSANATEVNVTLFIWGRYAPLVREDSEFWNVSGANVKGGLFSGVELKLESLRSLISGGVSFASPAGKSGQPSSPAAQDGARFYLHSEGNKDWEAWAPKIPIESESATIQDNTSGMKAGKEVSSEIKANK